MSQIEVWSHKLLSARQAPAPNSADSGAGAGVSADAEQPHPSAPKRCACCGAASGPGVTLRLCSGCRLVRFCGAACQRQMWPEHKAACKAAAAAAEQR
jgi:hypothetical protein